MSAEPALEKKKKELTQLIATIRGGSEQDPSGQVDDASAEVRTQTTAEQERLLAVILAGSDTLPYEPVPSSRRFIGPLIFGTKRIFLRFLRPLLSMILTPQIHFNENLAEGFDLKDKQLKKLDQDTQLLYHSYQSLLLKCECLEAENLRQKKELEVLSEKLKPNR